MLSEILLKDYAGISKYHSGELVNRIFSDVNVVTEGVINILPPFVLLLTQIIGASVILFGIDPQFLFIILAAAALSLLAALCFKKKSKALHREMQSEEGKVHAVMQESLQNIRLIKASESEEHIKDRANERQSSFFKAQMRRANFVTFANTGINSVFRIGWLYAMLWGCFGISRRTITYGTLMAVLQLVGQIQAPFASMSGLLSKFYSMLASAERINEIYSLPEEEPKTFENTAAALYKDLENISFENVSFAYDKGEKTIENADFTINKGDFTALTGLSGGGKSTLFLLLLGIYAPSAGKITFKTHNGCRKAGRDTRCIFAYVPQGNTLFSGTLRENITMFCENAGEDEIINAAKTACIYDFISSLPKGLDTVIGERGLGISEGQAQRIAVARALLSPSPILLLDEATSALDEKTEAQLLKNISNSKTKTCFIVTHRPAALAICNRRLSVENGVVDKTVGIQ